MKRQMKQGMSVLLSAAMVLSGVNAGNLYAAENDDTVKTIIGFDELDEKVAVQTLTAGDDDENDIKFPKKIWAEMIVEKTEEAEEEETKEAAETTAAAEETRAGETEAETEETEAEAEETEAETEETEAEAEETEAEAEETEAETEETEAEAEETEAETEETEAEAEETEAETEETEAEAEETEAETEETEAEAEETEAETEETEAEAEETEAETEETEAEAEETEAETEESESETGDSVVELPETETETEETLEMIELVPAATASEAEKEEAAEETVRKTIKNVEWELNWTESTESEFDPSVPGTYVYEPIIPSEYEMDMDVRLPQIKVVVEEDVRAVRASVAQVSNEEELESALQAAKPFDIELTDDITFSKELLGLDTYHKVTVPLDKTLTITGKIQLANQKKLTFAGDGTVEVKGGEGCLSGKLYLGSEGEKTDITVCIEDGSSIIPADELYIRNGATLEVNSSVGMIGNSSKRLIIENGGTLTGSEGAGIVLTKDFNVTGAAGVFSDQGEVLSENGKVTVASDSDEPAANKLTAGTYVWDGSTFTKPKQEPDDGINTEAELKEAVSDINTPFELPITGDIELTGETSLAEGKQLEIPAGNTLTVSGKILQNGHRLTFVGEGTVIVQGGKECLSGRIYLGTGKSDNDITVIVKDGSSIALEHELEIKKGATVEVNSEAGFIGKDRQILKIYEGGKLIGSEGAGIELSKGFSVTDPTGAFSDQGKAFNTTNEVVVGSSSDKPEDNKLTAGSYIWDDAAQKFVKAAPDPLPPTSFENGVLICSEQSGEGQGDGGISWVWDAENNTLNINRRFVGARQIIFAKSEPAVLRVNGNVELNPDAGCPAITSAGNLTFRIDKPKNENELTPIFTVHGAVNSKGNVELINDTQLVMEGNHASLNAEGTLTLRSTSTAAIKNEDGGPAIKAGGGIIAKDQSVIKAESTSTESTISSGKVSIGGTASVTAVNNGDGSAMSSAPDVTAHSNPRISASTSPQGRPGAEYDPANIADYKYIKIREKAELPADPSVDDIAKMADSVQPEDLDAVDDLIAQINKLDPAEKKALSSETLEKADALLQEAAGIVPEVQFSDESGAASNMQIQPENTKIMGALVAAGLDTNVMGKKVEFKVTQVKNAEGVYAAVVCEFLVDGVKQEFDFPVTVYLGLPSAYFPLSEDQIHQTGNGIDRWLDFTYDGADNTAVFVVNELSAFNVVRKGSGIKPPAGGGGGSHASGGSSSGGGGGRGGAAAGGPGAVSASAAGRWIQDEKGWWYQYNDQTYPKDGWFQLGTAGDWYYFDKNGYMAAGWVLNNGKWYYLSAAADETQGKMLTGWQLIDGKWYYLNEVSDGTRGAMAADTWIGEYYVNKDGVWDKNVKRQ